jgi:cytoskeletal protein RodZ
MPQVKTKQTSNKGKKDSSSSSNNNNAKSNIVASSSSIDSTNDTLTQVTLEQENDLLKGIIEKGIYKSLAGSRQFEEIVHKQGRHRKNQGVGFE